MQKCDLCDFTAEFKYQIDAHNTTNHPFRNLRNCRKCGQPTIKIHKSNEHLLDCSSCRKKEEQKMCKLHDIFFSGSDDDEYGRFAL